MYISNSIDYTVIVVLLDSVFNELNNLKIMVSRKIYTAI